MPSARTQASASFERDVQGDGVDDAVGAATAGVFEHRRDGRAFERGRARVDGKRAAPRHGIGGENGARPLGERRPHRAQPDGAQADDDDRPTRRNVGLLRADPARRQVVGQQQRGLVVDAVGDAQQLKVGVRHGDRGGLAAAEHAGAEDLHAAHARDRVARRAPGAPSAPGDRCRQHAVADRARSTPRRRFRPRCR